MSTSYYIYSKSEYDRDIPSPGELIGVFQGTRPEWTWVWAVNPMRLLSFSQEFTWVQDEYKHEPIMLSTLCYNTIRPCGIQTYNNKEIPA